MAIYDFETGVQGWVQVGGSTVTHETTTTHSGTGALRTSRAVTQGATAITEAGSPANPDLTGVTLLSMWVRIASSSPAIAGVSRARIRVMSNVTWAHTEGAYFDISKDAWTELTFDLSGIDPSTIGRVDLQAESSLSDAGTYAVLIDDVEQHVEAEPPPPSGGIANVEVRVDGGAWTAAIDTSGDASWSTWNYDLNLESLPLTETHTVEARATDLAGNVSTIDSETFYYSPSGAWAASPSGSGHLVPVEMRSFSMSSFPESPDYMSHGLITSKEELDLSPTTGTLWTQLTTEADRDDHPIAQISDHNAPFNTQTLAKAIVYARLKGHDDVTADAHRVNVAGRLQDFVNHTWATGASTLLAYARNLGALAIAADFINLASYDATLDANFRTKLQEGMTRVDATATDGFTSLHDGSLRRPNNIGMACRFSLTCGYLYLGDTASLDTYVIPPYRRFLGDTSYHNGSNTGVDRFNWNADQTWQMTPATESTWVGINPQGATKDGHVFDGIQPEDQRRGTPISYSAADFPNNYSAVKYIYDVANILTWMTIMLERNGYTGARAWSNEAVRRATERLIHFENTYAAKGYTKFGAAGQDAVAGINYIYGTSHPVPDPINHYDAYFAEAGWTEWMFSGRTL